MSYAYPIPRDVVTPCAQDPDLFFDTERVSEARSVCDGCSWRDECLSWALRKDEEGVWSGSTEKERAVMRRAYGIVAEKPKIIEFADTPTAKIPHGTAAGVEAHRKNGSKVCKACNQWRRENRADACALRVCGDCGRAMLPKSLPKHRRDLHSSEVA